MRRCDPDVITPPYTHRHTDAISKKSPPPNLKLSMPRRSFKRQNSDAYGAKEALGERLKSPKNGRSTISLIPPQATIIAEVDLGKGVDSFNVIL